jgi:hypothetical protein
MAITVSSATEAEIIVLKQGVDYVCNKTQGLGPEDPVAAAAITLQSQIITQYNTGGYAFNLEPQTDIVDNFG